MKKVYDFSNGKRGAVVPANAKTRITIASAARVELSPAAVGASMSRRVFQRCR